MGAIFLLLSVFTEGGTVVSPSMRGLGRYPRCFLEGLICVFPPCIYRGAQFSCFCPSLRGCNFPIVFFFTVRRWGEVRSVRVISPSKKKGGAISPLFNFFKDEAGVFLVSIFAHLQKGAQLSYVFPY